MKHQLEVAQRSWLLKTTVEEIQSAVARYFNLSLEEVRQNSRKRKFAMTRRIAIYLVKQLTDATLCEIARQFGFKEHTTILRSIAKIEEQRHENAALDQFLEELSSTLKQPLGTFRFADADKNLTLVLRRVWPVAPGKSRPPDEALFAGGVVTRHGATASESKSAPNPPSAESQQVLGDPQGFSSGFGDGGPATSW